MIFELFELTARFELAYSSLLVKAISSSGHVSVYSRVIVDDLKIR
jgi:hypothetical protein